MDQITTFSKIIAGTMTWGNWGMKFSEKETLGLIAYCLELGVTTFDHADIYGGYTNEADFGKAFKKSGISRNSLQLISKCGIQLVCDARNNQLQHYDYSKDYITKSVEQSLRNLKTDYLDMLLLHRPSPLLQPEIVAEAVLQLQQEGKIRAFGVSNFSPSQIALLETVIPVVSNQIEFSLTAHDVMYNGTLDDCMAKKRMAMSWSPLGSFFKKDDAQAVRIRKVLEPLLEKYEASADQLLLAWILKHPSRIYPVIGTTKKERLKASVDALQINLELEDWFILLKASQGHEVP